MLVRVPASYPRLVVCLHNTQRPLIIASPLRRQRLRAVERVLWRPPPGLVETSELARFQRACGYETYEALWQWSVSDIEGFWIAVWDWFGIWRERSSTRLGAQAVPLFDAAPVS